MKAGRLLVVVAVLSLSLLSCCAMGATTIFERNFDDGNPGDIVIGWSALDDPEAFRTSANVIDSGNSAILGGVGNVRHVANLVPDAYVIGAGETVSFTHVVTHPGLGLSNGSSTYVDIKSREMIGGVEKDVYWRNWIYKDNKFYWYTQNLGSPTEAGVFAIPTTVAEVLDMRIDFSAAGTDFLYRDHGASDWILFGHSTLHPTNIVSVAIYGETGSTAHMPAIDSVKLEVTTIPEPGTLLALASGFIGLAGFAVRRRR